MVRNQEGLEPLLRTARENLRKQQQKRRKEREATRKAEQLAKDREEELKKVRQNLEEEKEKARMKDAELAKFRRQAPGKIGFADEGSMQWKVEVKEIGPETVHSPYTLIGDVPFRIACREHVESGVKYLAVFLHCNDNSQDKTCYAGVFNSLRLAGLKPYHRGPDYDLFTSSKNSWGWHKYMKWQDAVDPAKGFVKNDCFTIEADIKLICFYKNAIADFCTPDSLLSDVVLLVGEKEFHENRIFLAHFSGYFKALFFSGFSEKSKDRVELPEVDPSEFEELLKMIHPQREKTKATKDNVNYLLRLGDFFDMQIIIWECIDFVKSTSDLTLVAKLQLTEQYRLPELQYHLLENMNTAKHFEEVITSETFESLSYEMKTTLFQKHFKLRVPM